MLLTYVGVGIAFYENLQTVEGHNITKGTILVFCAALTYAGYIVGSGQLLPKIGTIRYNSISMSAACLGVFIHKYRFEWILIYWILACPFIGYP